MHLLYLQIGLRNWDNFRIIFDISPYHLKLKLPVRNVYYTKYPHGMFVSHAKKKKRKKAYP